MRFFYVFMAILCLSLVAAVCSSANRLLPALPERKDIVQSGCSITLNTLSDQKTSWWHANAWIEYSDGSRFHKLLSIRYPHDRFKSLKDCNEFLDKIAKEKKK